MTAPCSVALGIRVERRESRVESQNWEWVNRYTLASFELGSMRQRLCTTAVISPRLSPPAELGSVKRMILAPAGTGLPLSLSRGNTCARSPRGKPGGGDGM